MATITATNRPLSPTLRWTNADGRLTAEGYRMMKAIAVIVDAVTVSDGEITTAMLADLAVTASKVGTGAIIAAKIAAGAILAEKIAAGAVTTDKLEAAAVTAEKVAAGAITAEKISVSSLEAISATLGDVEVNGDLIVNGTIQTAKIALNAITAALINAGAITADKIATGAVTADKILAGAVQTAKLDAGAVTADKISTGAVTADKILAGAVTATKISVASLEAISATLGNVAVNGNLVVNGTIVTNKIGANQITRMVVASPSTYTISSGGSKGAIKTQAISLDSAGGDVLIMFFAQQSLPTVNGNNYGTYTLTLKVGSSTLLGRLFAYDDDYTNAPALIFSNPASGSSQTYSVELDVAATGGVASFLLEGMTMVIIQYKR